MMKHIKVGVNAVVSSFPIGIVVSDFNPSITEVLLAGTLERLKMRGIDDHDMCVVHVPGAIEIPLVAQALSKRFSVIIALGAVIRGETSHYDLVCNTVADGCQHITLATGVPIIFGVLTTENEAQAWDRLGGKHGHKGIEMADAAITMHHVLQALVFGEASS